MSVLTFSAGSIIELIGHDSPHCGVVLDDHHVIELIAYRNEALRKMYCKLILINTEELSKHPLTHKPPSYKLRQDSSFPWTKAQISERIKKLRFKYEDKEYHIINKNCQHFAWELATGEAKSPDADKFAAVGGFIGFVVSMKDFGSTSSSMSLTDLIPFSHSLMDYLVSA
jgi:hypothetical protein